MRVEPHRADMLMKVTVVLGAPTLSPMARSVAWVTMASFSARRYCARNVNGLSFGSNTLADEMQKRQ